MVDPDFVLGSFQDEDKPVLERCLDIAVDACRNWLGGHSLKKLMNEVNAFRGDVSGDA